MQRVVLARFLEGEMNQTAVRFRPERAMYYPLLIPHRFEGASRHFRENRFEMRRTEGAESGLILRTGIWRDIWIARIKRCASIDQIETGLEIRLKQHVHMNPCGEVASVAQIAASGIDGIGAG